MAKLYFRYGTVGSAKTLNLLAVAHNYDQQDKKCVVVKPAIDDRYGIEWVQSRSNLKRKADIVLKDADNVEELILLMGNDLSCVLVDEVQFLSTLQIEQLRSYVDRQKVPVISYGLRGDFKTQLFSGSKRLLELADSIEEVKNTCHYCNSKALFNLKLLAGKPTLKGPQVEIGAEEKYLPVCSQHYFGSL